MELIDLTRNLKTHEMERKAREEMVPQNRKVIAFKFTLTISDDDEEFSLLVKNVRRMYNKAKFNNRRRWQEKEDRKVICFNCQKPDHMVADCPKTKSKPSTSKNPAKRKLSKLRKTQRVKSMKKWIRHTCVSWLMIIHLR